MQFAALNDIINKMIIVATVSNIRFRGDSGWAVVDFVDETNMKFVGVGSLPAAYEGEKLELTGEWTVHRIYGKQFNITSCKHVPVSGADAILKFLSGGFVKGVGLPTAKAIVGMFGDRSLEVIEKEPSRLEKIPGIGMVKSKMIHDSYMEKNGIKNVYVGLTALGFSVNQAVKIYRLYGDECLRLIRENPYRLIKDVDRIGFATADKIAMNAGFEHDSPFRIRAGILYTLGELRADGNTCYPKDILAMKAANEVLGVGLVPVEEMMEAMIVEGELVEKELEGEDLVFLSSLHFREMDSAVRLNDIMNEADILPLSDIEGNIDALERRLGIELADKQREAVRLAFEEGVLVITGGPGTGKTTILRFIIEMMEDLGLTLELAAPTGRAAKRISDTTGREARTIHRLLEYGGSGEETFARDESYPIEADAVIVDEMSMVDVPLFHSLVKAVSPGTRLIMVGDFDQLPPIGPGNVLKDLILSETLPVVRLTDIYRQAGRSMIVVNAHRINNGMIPVTDANEDDFQFISIPDNQRALEYVLELSLKLENSGAGEFQILAPMKGNVLGVNNLNSCLQEKLNPRAEGKAERLFGETVFRVGDRVMQTRNNYKLEWKRIKNGAPVEDGSGVFNGDIGTVMEILPSGSVVRVLFDDERLAEYGQAELPDIELAYAISVHKSQGSEFGTVILPLVYGPPMLMSRNILYTAVTRARDRVIIVGSAKCVAGMVNNVTAARRYTGLKCFMEQLRS